MKNNYYLLLLFAAFCCMGVQCKKEEPDKVEELTKLPPATTKGRNTFGCLINGKAFPQSSEGYHEKMVYYNDGELFINYSTNFSTFDLNESISIMLKRLKSEGSYLIEFGSPIEEFIVVYSKEERFSSTANTNNVGSVTIIITRLDTINQVVSGTFSFKLKNDSGNKEVSVEHGRFDFQYQ